MSKLDPKLGILLNKKEQVNQSHRTVRANKASEETPQEVRILLKFSGDISELQALGFQPEAVAGNIASGRVSMNDLPALVALDSVIKIEMSRPMRSMLDNSVPSIKANEVHSGNPAFKGAGVIVGVIDNGIDFTHPCFRKENGTSRILFLWNQTLEHPNNAPAGYGNEYTKAQIDQAFSQQNPFHHVLVTDLNSHGSHVAGIAAGDGSVADHCRLAGTFVGVAPEADLIFVRFAKDKTETGESTHFTAALSYIFDKAAELNKPAVINISFGSFIGPHDGTSLVEQFIDNLLVTAGRAVVNAAGNAAEEKLHAQGIMTVDNDRAEVKFRVSVGHKFPCYIDLWYSGDDRFRVNVAAPGEEASSTVAPGGNPVALTLANGNTVTINSQLNDSENGDNRIYIEIDPGSRRTVEAGIWTLNLFTDILLDGEFHCWLEEGLEVLAHFLDPYASQANSLGIPATSRKTITVGAYSDRGLFSNGKLMDFSSRGPTRDGRIKPEIVAPGDSIMSVRSSTMAKGDVPCFLFCCNKYAAFSGTSMAAPHVAGVIALMLQKNPELTIDGIRNHLFQHTQTNEDEMGTLPNNSWGYGIVDAKAAIDAVPIADGVPTTPQPPDIQPVAIGSTSMTSGAASLSPNLLSQIEFDILQTSMGHHYAHLVQKHFDEVRTLVNTNQRVGAVWVRGGGPTIVRRLLQAIYTPDEPIPSVIEGKLVVESLRRFLAILRRYGSPALRADLDRHSDMLLQFEGLSYNQFLAQLH